MPTSDAVSAFLDAMEAAGMKPVGSISSRLGSDILRFQCKGDRKGKQNGWAVLHLDARPAGAFGNYRLGISERWRADCPDALTRDERRVRAKQYRDERARREAIIHDGQALAAVACSQRWQRASDVDSRHPYLVAKGVTGEGLKLEANRLLVPMFGADGLLWNLQTIDPDGVKRFAKGGRQGGLHLLLGDPDAALAVAEGYGTGAVVRRATGLPVAVAFSGKNLTATAIAMRERFPGADIIIAADDDAHLVDHPQIKRNLGLDYAHAAAQAVGGRVAVPPRKSA